MTPYSQARIFFADRGIDTERAMERAHRIPISIHCWQGDDVSGFMEKEALSGGIQVTGFYPGKAETANELREDLDTVFSLVPGAKRLNLHAIYAETGGKKVERNELDFSHFTAWKDWALGKGCAVDFNPTLFPIPWPRTA